MKVNLQPLLITWNGDEKNKEKLIKMVNLTDGGYVSKDKYTNLETDLSGKTTELTKANNLIEELKKSAGKDEETQQKITAYETEIADLTRKWKWLTMISMLSTV